MVLTDVASPYQKCINPWQFDRIEVRADVFVGPVVGTHHRAFYERPTVRGDFCLLGAWCCEYESGPHLGNLAAYCAKLTGEDGMYGIAGLRRVNRVAATL